MKIIRKLASIIAATALSFSLFSFTALAEEEFSLVTDNAGIIEDIDEIEDAVIDAADNSGNLCDILIYTTDEYLSSPMSYADDRLDEYLAATGKKDGVMLVISTDSRDWWITTTGYGITAFTDYGIDKIGELIVDDLSDGNYDEAFLDFAELCEKFIIEADENKPYDTNHKYRDSGFYREKLLFGSLFGVIITIIVVGTMVQQLKSAQIKTQANQFVKEGSLNIIKQSDIFLYDTVSKTKRSTETSSGGSSTHSSSSGTSHGGGGGKF